MRIFGWFREIQGRERIWCNSDCRLFETGVKRRRKSSKNKSKDAVQNGHGQSSISRCLFFLQKILQVRQLNHGTRTIFDSFVRQVKHAGDSLPQPRFDASFHQTWSKQGIGELFSWLLLRVRATCSSSTRGRGIRRLTKQVSSHFGRCGFRLVGSPTCMYFVEERQVGATNRSHNSSSQYPCLKTDSIETKSAYHQHEVFIII
jgi:hypothetical protein